MDTGSGDRMALGVLTQYRMATTEQMHRVIAPEVRIEQTRRRLARLRGEGRPHHPAAGRSKPGLVPDLGTGLPGTARTGHSSSRPRLEPRP
ncbi:hypothetical protein ABZ642_41985 [Streptomyces sp. NPDC007157]|uniref:hypothetical protein n=1 Tax=Streptomyces sp. NPDC007157 TaxID=3154681 RepID=UPI003405403B